MLPDACRALAATAAVARLGTIDPDGAPNLVPMVFALEQDTLACVVDAKPKRTTALARLRNIERDPRVTVLFDHYEDDWTRLWWVKARGTAQVVTDVSAIMERLRAKYAQYGDYEVEEIGIVIQVQHWSGWSYTE
jgi:PPOX class probable F420-dependent enzyme